MELTRNEVKAIGDRVIEILKTKPNRNHNLGYVAQKIYGQCYIYISYCLAERLGVGLADVKDDTV